MALILDFAVVIILLLGAVIGWNKGFLKYIISSIGTVTAIVIAFLLADSFALTVYENWIQEPLRENIEHRLQDFDVVDTVSKEIGYCGYDVNISDKELKAALSSDGDISEKLAQFAAKNDKGELDTEKFRADMDSFFETRFFGKLNKLFNGVDTQKLGDSVEHTKNYSYDIVRALADNDKKLAADYIEDNLAKPIVVIIVKIVLTIVLFILISILIRILLKITGIFDHVVLVNGINRFFGLITGLIKHLALVIIIAFAVSVVVKSSGDSLQAINTEIIDKTYLFRHLFRMFYDI